MTERPYSRWQFFLAVNLAALLGWAAVMAALMILSILLESKDFGLGTVIVGWLVYGPISAVFGLPVALVVCWIAVGPVLWIAMRRPVTWMSAAIWGFVAAVIVEVGNDALVSLSGTERHWDLGYWLASPGGIVSIALSGIGLALIERAIIGPGAMPGSVDAGQSNVARMETAAE